MTEQDDFLNLDSLEALRQPVTDALQETFVRGAIDNRGALILPRRGPEVAEQLFDLMALFVCGQKTKADVTIAATELAEQGLALLTGSALMRTLTTAVPSHLLTAPAFNNFLLLFLETLGSARELLQQRTQERSQAALQHALHRQLEQQIVSHEAQRQQNENLNQILQLNARLSRATEENMLLHEAIEGVSQALDLADVSLYTFYGESNQWHLRVNTAPSLSSPSAINQQLNSALSQGGETIRFIHREDQQDVASITIILKAGQRILGGIIVNDAASHMDDNEAYLIMLRTFTQNLASLWRNLFLLKETQQRTQELEILHGRYLDSIWNSEQVRLKAEFAHNQLHIQRNHLLTVDKTQNEIPLHVGDYPLGQVQLPDHLLLGREDQEFINALVREMGSALNNAQFLQTAHSYSNQLSVAADVSHAATTILDQDKLIEEVVELIRSRFNFYYVGLFLVNKAENKAVLQAGTGEAGRQMVAQNYYLAIDENSMIGTASATGEARVEQDIQATAFTRNPHLPQTRAELALPLRTRERTIGALTVQSTAINAFSQESVTVFQSLADQLAVAIENTGLFAQTQQNLIESNRLFAASRRITVATKATDVYQELVDFAADSQLVDLAQVLVPDVNSPDYLVSPAFWSRLGIKNNPQGRFSRDQMPFSEKLLANEIIRLKDGQTDPNVDPVTQRLFTRNNIRAATLVPIYTENRWLGTLALDRVTAVPLTDKELQPFITLADQAATILANQQLLQQTKTLYKIGRMLDQAITHENLLQIAVREVSGYIGAVHCRFVLYDHLNGHGFVAAESDNPHILDDIQFPLNNNFVYTFLAEKHEPLLLTLDSDDLAEEIKQQYLTPFDSDVSLLVPAFNQQELMGFLAIESHRSTRPFTANNIIFAQTVVDQVVTQIENINLLDEALQRAQELITLNQIQTTISHVLSSQQLARTTYKQVGRLLDNTVFTLAQYDAVSQFYEPLLHIVNGIEVKTAARTLHSDEPLYQLLQNDRPQTIDGSAVFMPETEDYITQLPQSSLSIPMQREDQITGLIYLQSYQPHAYQEQDMQLLRSIATQTNLALANASLFERIQVHNEELMQLDQLKNQFLANMSHELRTPLNSIIGFSRIILKGIDGPLTAEQEEDLTSIYQNGQHLLNLINEILDMAKIEAGKMTLTFEEIDIAQAVETVQATVRGLINLDKVDLIWNIDSNLPAIEADPIRLRQILLNLLSNAAKYTPEGKIRLHIKQEGEQQILISVQDSGIGIAEADFDKIFAAFEQADSSMTRAVGGTGLGMPITKWLVEMHQGHIYFESELNKGTTFYILLPIHLNHSLLLRPKNYLLLNDND
ncbi:MAG: GAF domain-containing protein [Chloroflexi bacterium]|nr:GAF domain-containing protein [Chloroflexota bacterium]